MRKIMRNLYVGKSGFAFVYPLDRERVEVHKVLEEDYDAYLVSGWTREEPCRKDCLKYALAVLDLNQ